MLSFLSEYWGTIIVSLIVIALVTLILVFGVIKPLKKGKSLSCGDCKGCGGACSGCAYHGSCHNNIKK